MSDTAAGRALPAATLNRTTLERQMLLQRKRIDPVSAIARLGGLQAQEPASPYLALWSRLTGFAAADLDQAFATHEVVKATLMRETLHAVVTGDYPAFWAAHSGSARRNRARRLRWESIGMTDDAVEALVETALSYAIAPRSNQEMAAHLNDRGVALDERDWWWAIRTFAPLVHAPATGPWSFARRPGYVAARTVVDALDLDPAEGLDQVVRQYLAAFGPATIGDIAQFTKLARSRVRASVARLADELRPRRDVEGRALVDLAAGKITAGSTPAPVRLLPMWDSVLLAYEDRRRLIPSDVRKVVIRSNGDILPTVLVDGVVAGVWRASHAAGRTRIEWCTFDRVSPTVRNEIDAEANALARFVEPIEPAVFARFNRWWSDPVIVESLAR